MNKSQNRLAILRRYMDAWAELPRHNRSLVAEIIYEKFQELGLGEHIAGTGVEFSSSDDYHKDMRVRGQKLWRWIGAYEEAKPQPDKLWYLEQVIVAAMPEPLRVAYTSEVYLAAQLSIGIDHSTDSTCPAKIARTLIKENSEAQAAVVELSRDSSQGDIDTALKELRESSAATRAAINALEQMREGK
ncbi:hypothetical protein [Gilvimarinus sp. 1_MG-2023]|uniref:hypothetical protein n=1 Tax=Gilvimarinus sp. 1_MG-2023 TaxID=3062638 RepID=UPI0026E31238|nr:hypothetical protein [Gilvimarinus sp. 1_MG-2023]MDO6747180.1 hypothetical protein [Gilvimarinus sp. 1_MG-2023]